MNLNGFSLGKLFGIEIRIAYSWFVLFGLIIVSFISGIPNLIPEISMLGAVVFGTLLTLLFFASVLAHELSHSVYAKKTGLDIDRLTLFIFGGAAELKEEPRTPKQEFIMAGLGPLSSILIGVFFIGVWFVGNQLNNEIIATGASILASLNIILAFFNLLPGYPLDGGRMFRAVVWHFTDNLQKATKAASTGGKYIAYLLMIYGGIEFLFTGAIGGIWLVFIGYFLKQAAEASYRHMMSRYRQSEA